MGKMWRERISTHRIVHSGDASPVKLCFQQLDTLSNTSSIETRSECDRRAAMSIATLQLDMLEQITRSLIPARATIDEELGLAWRDFA